MSLTGRAKQNMLLKGSINRLQVIYTDAYELDVKNGFEGTLEEWLASIKGEPGDTPYIKDGTWWIGEEDTGVPASGVTDEQVEAALAAYMENHPVSAASPATIGYVNLLAANWVGNDNPYSQVVTIPGVTENSQVDLTPSVEQLAVFYDKSLAFVTENEDGIVTVYAIGQKPENDYTIQVTITEVSV